MIRTLRVLVMTLPILAAADPPDRQEEPAVLEEAIVTGMRVGQGGAQDIRFFRGEVAFARIPHPEALTAEGLMSEHDIVLPATQACRQLFCLTGEAQRADLPAVPHARYLAGIGFATCIDEKKWKRERVNLVAVVDKSGSMDGEPLELVRESLAEVAKQLRAGDQMSIVLYGDRAHVHMAPTLVGRDGVGAIHRAISQIVSEGSTSMEAGLTLGYEVAARTAPAFDGRTRLILFTDERPNTDATDAESFMGMATEGSRRGVGLTTIGVGEQFDAALAVEIGSVRGGNLYYLRDDGDVKTLFKEQFDYMVSELAHDLRITITPRAGLRIAGVYGVPGELLGWQDETSVAITIPTVFLDHHGGGIFFTLAPGTTDSFLPQKADTAPLAAVAVSYRPLDGTTGTDAMSIAMHPANPSQGMALGALLIDEFTVLHAATSAHYLRNDQEAAYQLVSNFRDRLDASRLNGLEGEKELIASLHSRIAFLAGHGGEPDPRIGRLWGRWKVTAGSDGSGYDVGDVVEFTADNQVLRCTAGNAEPHETMEYESNENQILLTDQDLVLRYKVRGDRLTLRDPHDRERIELARVTEHVSAAH
jgi:Ca-activated chloride channel family protein